MSKNEITLYKNFKKRLNEESSVDRFVLEPVEEEKELKLVEAEGGSVIEIEVSYEDVDITENNELLEIDDDMIKLSKENLELKDQIYKLNKEVIRLQSVLTADQKLLFYNDEEDFNNDLTKAEKLLVEKRNELSRRSHIRKRRWFRQILC